MNKPTVHNGGGSGSRVLFTRAFQFILYIKLMDHSVIKIVARRPVLMVNNLSYMFSSSFIYSFHFCGMCHDFAKFGKHYIFLILIKMC